MLHDQMLKTISLAFWKLIHSSGCFNKGAGFLEVRRERIGDSIYTETPYGRAVIKTAYDIRLKCERCERIHRVEGIEYSPVTSQP